MQSRSNWNPPSHRARSSCDLFRRRVRFGFFVSWAQFHRLTLTYVNCTGDPAVPAIIFILWGMATHRKGHTCNAELRRPVPDTDISRPPVGAIKIKCSASPNWQRPSPRGCMRSYQPNTVNCIRWYESRCRDAKHPPFGPSTLSNLLLIATDHHPDEFPFGATPSGNTLVTAHRSA